MLGRGHMEKWVINSLAIALTRPCLKTLQGRKKENDNSENIIRCIVPYNANFETKRAFTEVEKVKKSLQGVPGGDFLQKSKTQLVFRICRSLRRLIVNKTNSPAALATLSGFQTDGCLFCKQISGNGQVFMTFPAAVPEFQHWQVPSATCKTKNVVYWVACLDCNPPMLYVGKTINALKDQSNRQAINTQ